MCFLRYLLQRFFFYLLLDRCLPVVHIVRMSVEQLHIFQKHNVACGTYRVTRTKHFIKQRNNELSVAYKHIHSISKYYKDWALSFMLLAVFVCLYNFSYTLIIQTFLILVSKIVKKIFLR